MVTFRSHGLHRPIVSRGFSLARRVRWYCCRTAQYTQPASTRTGAASPTWRAASDQWAPGSSSGASMRRRWLAPPRESRGRRGDAPGAVDRHRTVADFPTSCRILLIRSSAFVCLTLGCPRISFSELCPKMTRSSPASQNPPRRRRNSTQSDTEHYHLTIPPKLPRNLQVEEYRPSSAFSFRINSLGIIAILFNNFYVSLRRDNNFYVSYYEQKSTYRVFKQKNWSKRMRKWSENGWLCVLMQPTSPNHSDHKDQDLVSVEKKHGPRTPRRRRNIRLLAWPTRQRVWTMEGAAQTGRGLKATRTHAGSSSATTSQPLSQSS